MTNVRFPEMRAEVVGAVESLSDLEYQQRIWVRQEFPHPGFYDDFLLNLHILYDDTMVFENPAITIGQILRDSVEADALHPLKVALDALHSKYGKNLTDKEYLNTPEWPTVVTAARHALNVLTAPRA